MIACALQNCMMHLDINKFSYNEETTVWMDSIRLAICMRDNVVTDEINLSLLPAYHALYSAEVH